MAYSPLANPTATREILARFGLSAKYRLGQNFLIDDNIIGRIVDLAELEPCLGNPTRKVLEIGPGIGTLTLALLDRASVISIERDDDLVAVLAETTAFHSDRFALVQKDALKVELADIEGVLGAAPPTMLVANLPYKIAATVILDWFERFDFIESMVVMVQSEVADRIAAVPGCKDYGSYSIKLGLRARVSGRFQVAPTCFHPAPHVESAVVRLDRCPACDDCQVLDAACKVADAAFARRRKTIRNSLQSAFAVELIDYLLESCNIPASVRAERLEMSDFIRMGKSLLAYSCR